MFLVSREAQLEPPRALGRRTCAAWCRPRSGFVFTTDSRAADLSLLGLTPRAFDEGAPRTPSPASTPARTPSSRRSLRCTIETLADVLCPHDLPVFYRAALLLVTGAPGSTTVRHPAQDPGFGTPWDGFVRADVGALFDTWEVRNPARDPEDALLAVSALVLGKTSAAVGERARPSTGRSPRAGRSPMCSPSTPTQSAWSATTLPPRTCWARSSPRTRNATAVRPLEEAHDDRWGEV